MIRDRYSVAEAAARIGVGPWTLRRLETLGRIPAAQRDALCGFRVYDDDEIEQIKQAIGISNTATAHTPA